MDKIEAPHSPIIESLYKNAKRQGRKELQEDEAPGGGGS
jgi:hypothetical protein